MKKLILIFISVIFLVSCEKSDEFLTSGTWVHKQDYVTGSKETVRFNNDGTYIIETRSYLNPGNPFSVRSGSVKGEWKRVDSEITFINANVTLKTTDNFNTEFPLRAGYSVAEFFGLTRLYQYSDSISADSLRSVIDSWRPPAQNGSELNVWHIQSISKETLVVVVDSITEEYYKE
jgi:hypothetical protein